MKGTFRFWFVVSIILVVGASCVLFFTMESRWWLGLVALVVGGFIVIWANAAMGMVLEFFDNVAIIKKRLCSSMDAEEAEMKEAIKLSTWVCTGCKTKNAGSSDFCINCGLPKVAIPMPATPEFGDPFVSPAVPVADGPVAGEPAAPAVEEPAASAAPAAPARPRCPKCGRYFTSDNVFCTECGVRLE